MKMDIGLQYTKIIDKLGENSWTIVHSFKVHGEFLLQIDTCVTVQLEG